MGKGKDLLKKIDLEEARQVNTLKRIEKDIERLKNEKKQCLERLKRMEDMFNEINEMETSEFTEKYPK